MGKARILFLILALASGRVAAEVISVPSPSCVPVAQSDADGQRLRAMGYGSISSPGDPALPFKEIHIILPPNAVPASVSVRLAGSTRRLVPVQQEVAPAPPMAASIDGKEVRDWGRGKQIRGNRNVLVYEKAALYPNSNVELASVGNLRKWRIATVRYYPFRYNPVTRMLEESSSGNIVVSYRSSPAHSLTAQSARLMRDSVFSKRVEALTANYAQAQSWYSVQTPAPVSAFADSEATTDYVIITTSAIVTGSAKLQAFVDHKTARGFKVAVLTELQWGVGAGDSAAMNIRAYLQANYIAKGIKYVLLIGNPAPVTGDVPMKMLWPRYTSDTYREAPSDYFYADLTGNWDLNGNGYYGEEVGDFGPGGIDRFPEVIVGRIPCYGDFSALDSILQKTINYESGMSPGGWVRNVLLSMKPSDSSTPGYQLGEAIKDDVLTPAAMTATRLYDSDYGLSPAPEHVPCTYDNVLAAWQQHAGFHFWWTHGNETLAAEVFNTENCQYLDDSYPAFTFQCSCLNAAPENSGNLAYSLLKRGAIATDAATRVSWYSPGETDFTVSDTNAGMTYTYAKKLIGEHMPCGDAHFAMMVDVPNQRDYWMNHCVFNLYGDPSVEYPMAPIISHKPLGNTDDATQAYAVRADVTATSPLASGYPILRWNTTGGPEPEFNASQMTLTIGASYTASIPAQPYGTTVYYYIEAADSTGLSSTYPTDAPQSLLSFRVMQDLLPPTIIHTPLVDTADKFGPYVVGATVTDDIGVGNVSLYYCFNGGAYNHADMTLQSGDLYQASIPGPAQSGDTIGYYITATDASINANVSRLPVGTGSYSFGIGSKIYVAVFNTAAVPTYFTGGNSNAWSSISSVINADPTHRFQVSVVTNLTPSPGSIGIDGHDVLVLPDNAVPTTSLQAVSNWFQPGKVIVALDSAACYAAYTGWMWPAAAGTNGYAEPLVPGYWDYSSGTGDQEIWTQDPITSGYTVGTVIGSVVGDAAYYVDKLPSDAHVLAGRANNHNRAYAIYRDVPGRGRLVLLGPYITPMTNQWSMIREALIAPPQLSVVSPNGGETYQAGDLIRVTYMTSGSWQDSDRIKLEYCPGLDTVWRPIIGAESLDYDLGSFQWNTAGLPGSHLYRVRATRVGDTFSDQSDAAFTIIPTVGIVAAKSVDNGELIRLAGKVVTSGITGLAYVEEPDRGAGIRIESAQSLTPCALVNIVGTMGTIHGERVLNAESVDPKGTGAQIKPFAMKAAALGGSSFGLQDAVMECRLIKESDIWVPHVLPAVGLNNIGLLVRLCGKVTAIGDGFFYLDDGSGCSDGSASPGVRVICPETLSLTVDQYILIDAVSSTYFDGTTTWRAVVMPDRQGLRLQ